jgi:DNA processing protein
MTPDTRIDRLRLARTPGIGPITYRRLLRRFPDPAEAIDAMPGLARAGGRTSPLTVPSADRAAREIEAVETFGGRFVFLGDDTYPELLALLEDPPPALIVHGDLGVAAAPCVALVGGRNASANGQRMGERLGRELAAIGFTIVSGLARGVDGAAHRGALATGRTVAAIAGGLDRPYPSEHAGLQREIVEAGGAVVTEAPLGMAPTARHFPRRNRVIAGLSLGVVVVEAARRSGSLITARLAQESGRELFAVPGSPLDARCEGSNDLIRQGAHLTEAPDDILRNLPDHPSRQGLARDPLFRSMATSYMPPLTQEGPGCQARDTPPAARAEVVSLLGTSPTPVDDLVRRCQFSAAAVMAVLLELELAGRVDSLPGNRVALNVEHGS